MCVVGVGGPIGCAQQRVSMHSRKQAVVCWRTSCMQVRRLANQLQTLYTCSRGKQPQLTLGVEVGAALAAAHGQGGQGVLEDLQGRQGPKPSSDSVGLQLRKQARCRASPAATVWVATVCTCGAPRGPPGKRAGDCCTMCQLDCTAARGTLNSGFTRRAAAPHIGQLLHKLIAVPTCSKARNFMMDRFTAGQKRGGQ